jgi:catechol 2,3-dioxygenase-like lactoylglutathione lyase family enzyme
VSNLDRAIAFYRDGLSLPMREGDSGVAFFQLRGLWLALFPREALAEDAGVSSAGHGFSGFSLAHNVRTNGEVDALLEQAVAAGGLLVKAGQPAFWGGYSRIPP